MVILKCKMCGGDLHPNEGATTCECEYCGSIQTIPTADNEKKMNLFSRAQRLLRACEFDKAAGVYETIVAEFPEEAEAYWGIVLCKYGIEYVDDPGTGRKVPTCHRTRSESILDDSDFEQACENSDPIAKRVYRESAKEIDKLQQDILSVVANESPYDVFICYKETGEDGQRTEDSVLAQDIYDALTAKDLKVFFARITLEDKLGQQYEPYIYAALHSAKVMLAIGTQFEYYDAVWVKNEWVRFLDMMKGDKTKVLIPCYKSIDAYDMPREFKNLQAQDMGKLGWLQDLTRGVMKLCGKDDKKAQKTSQQVVTQVVQSANPTVKSLLDRAFIFLEDGDFAKADDYCEQVLNTDPSNGRAYLGKLMTRLKVRRETDLENQLQPFDDYSLFHKIMRFGDEALKKQMQECIEHINARNVYERQKVVFHDASDMLRDAHTVEQCQEAKALLESIASFEGAEALMAECEGKIEEIRRSVSRQEEAKEKINVLQTQIDSVRKINEDKIRAYQTADQRVKELENATKEARRELGKNRDTVSRAESELHNLRGLFVGRRRRELEEEIKLALNNIQSAEAKLKKLEEEYEKAVAAMPDKPAMADQANEQEFIYQCASIYREAKLYDLAWQEYNKIHGYKDVDSIITNDENIAAVARVFAWRSQFIVGNTIKYGSYCQNGKASIGSDPIEWLVLDNNGREATLISKYCLDTKQFNDEYIEVTWETCTIRMWLNNEFLNTAFTTDEQAKLSTVIVTADANPESSSDPGRNTQDKVFLLSVAEAIKYFASNLDRVCIPTKTAIENGSEIEDGGCHWWLRTPGDISLLATGVYSNGAVGNFGDDVINEGGVRPVIVLMLS